MKIWVVLLIHTPQHLLITWYHWDSTLIITHPSYTRMPPLPIAMCEQATFYHPYSPIRRVVSGGFNSQKPHETTGNQNAYGPRFK